MSVDPELLTSHKQSPETRPVDRRPRCVRRGGELAVDHASIKQHTSDLLTAALHGGVLPPLPDELRSSTP